MFPKLKSLVIDHRSLVIILIIASFFRLYNLSIAPPGLYQDEAMNGNNAAESWETRQWKVFYPENFGREGLFINIQSIFVAIFGHKAWALRLPSAIFGILTVLGLYFFTKELFGENSKSQELNSRQIQNTDKQNSKLFRVSNLEFRNYEVALLASFLMATSFWHINFSRIGFRAIMAPFFLVWALYFLLKSLNARRYTLNALIGGLLYGLGFHSYIAYRITPILIIFLLYFYFKNYFNALKSIKIVFLTFLAAAITAILPLGIYFTKNPADFFGRTAQISIFQSPTPVLDLGLNIIKTAGMFNLIGDFNWRHNSAGQPFLFWPVGVLFLIGILIGFKKIIRIPDAPYSDVRKFPFLILFSWLLIVALPVIISNEGLPHSLRSLLMAPTVFILAAVGGLKIYQLFLISFSDRRWSQWLAGIFLAIVIVQAYYSYFIRWSRNPNVQTAFAYRDTVIAKTLNSLPAELSKYVVVKNVRGEIRSDNPISLQTILFLTDTFSDEKRLAKRIFYIREDEFSSAKLTKSNVIIRLP